MPKDALLDPTLPDSPSRAGVDEVVPILASGKNVVSPIASAMHWRHLADGKGLRDELDKACAEGNRSIFFTGIDPGFVSDCLAITMSSLVGDIEQINTWEVIDYSTYPAFSIEALGFGQRPEDLPATGGAALRASWGCAPYMMAERCHDGHSPRAARRVLVADFSRVLAGPYATMLLADLGADVVKVESPQGDDTRSWMPPVRDGVSTYYLGINRNKRSIVLDIHDEAEARLARELARRADIVIENFKPGGLARYGLDYGSVSVGNPGVVYASITGFGTGPGRHVPGYDLMVQAISGLMSLTGDADGPPFRAGISVFDVMAGNHAAIGILAALRYRDVTGRGQHVEVNLLSSALTGLVNHSSAYVAGGTVPYRMGNAHPSVFPYEPLPTADQDLIVAAANDGQFRKLCEVLGIPEVADDPRFAHNADRTEHRGDLRRILVERLRTKSALEWFELLIDAGAPCGPINTIDGGFAMAERFGLDPVVDVGDGVGPHAVPTTRHPIRFSETPATYRLPPPARPRRARRRSPEMAGGRALILGWTRNRWVGTIEVDEDPVVSLQAQMEEVAFRLLRREDDERIVSGAYQLHEFGVRSVDLAVAKPQPSLVPTSSSAICSVAQSSFGVGFEKPVIRLASTGSMSRGSCSESPPATAKSNGRTAPCGFWSDSASRTGRVRRRR